MKIKCIIGNDGYSSKPQGFEVAALTKRMTIDSMKEYSIEEIKESILQGKTIRPAYCGSKEDSWVSQQIFMIDIDDNLTIDQAIDKCNNIKIIPNFIYTSFSHTKEHHKFRLVYLLDKEINDHEIAKKIQLFLMNTITESDPACKNLNRFYYAGKSIVFNSGEILDAHTIMDLSKDIAIGAGSKKVKESKPACNPGCTRDLRKGVLDNKGVYSNLSSTPKTPLVQNTIKAIAERDIAYLKGKYGSGEKKLFKTKEEFFNYIRKAIDLGEFLEFSYPKSIRCTFHDDHNNSASIFQADDGAWIYKCHSGRCAVSYNIIGVIERLGNFQSRAKTYNFIKEIFNLEIMETVWQKEQKDILQENLRILNDGEFEINCPQAYKNIKGITHYYEMLTYIAMDNVYNENLTDNEGQVVFFISGEFICKQMRISPNSNEYSVRD